MPKIKAIPDGMREMARRIDQGSMNLWNNQRAMGKIFANLEGCFSGRVPGLILQRVTQMEKSYRRLSATLDKYSVFLRNRADSYEMLDALGAEQFNSLIQGNKRASQWFKLGDATADK